MIWGIFLFVAWSGDDPFRKYISLNSVGGLSVKAKSRHGDYEVYQVGIVFIVVNKRNAIPNKRTFATKAAALNHARKLAYWHKNNQTPNSLARRAIMNEKIVKAYHAKKK